MNIKNAIRDLKADVPRLKLHLKESKEGIRQLREDVYSDVEDLKTQLFIAEVEAQYAVKEEKSWARGVTRTYLKTHAKALCKGAWADLKVAALFAWTVPFGLTMWALLILIGAVVTVATFNLRKGRETVERLIDAL